MERYYQYLILCLLLIISYVYALVFAPAIANSNEGWKGKFNSAHESCLAGDGCKLPFSIRGEKYIITGDPATNDRLINCAMTFWSGTHFLLYSFIGFLCPDLFWETLFIGVAFEYYEYRRFDCHDTLDILLNTGGFILGRSVNKLLYSSKREDKVDSLFD
jgi:hypothetical protein